VPNLLTNQLIAGSAALTEPIASGEETPAGGAVAALVTALAASVTAAVAERSRGVWEEAPAIRAQAQVLRRRALELAQRDADAHATAQAHLDSRSSESGQAADWELGRSVAAAAEPPLELAACARDLAQLAELASSRAEGDVRADAVVATMLAAAGARAAAHLVEINLVAGVDDQRLGEARARVREAESAASSASTIR
jgi:formiminotetrahydrofolate cyclodeaminase